MLLTEIQNTGLTDDAAIVEHFNTPSIPAKGAIETKLIKQYLILRDLRVAIKNGSSAACQQVNLALDDFATFDCSNPMILAKLEQVLDDLIADNLVPAFIQVDKDYILSMADTLITPAQSLGLIVNFETVAQALRG
ncbi:MAG: hypothetical protein WBI40_09260 [Methylococcaceae bacterium]